MEKITPPVNFLEILAGAVGLLLILSLVQLIAYRRMAIRMRQLTHLLRVTDRENLEEFIETYKTNIENIHRQLDEAAAWRQSTEEILAGCVRTPVMMRYRAFEDIGGDQSYSCAVLDGKGDGVVFTSLYSSNCSYSYGKPVRQGRSEYPLSAEEQKVMDQASKS